MIVEEFIEMTRLPVATARKVDKEEEKGFFTPESVREAWNLAMADLLYPPLPDPEVVETGEEGGAWIEEDNWQIQVNNFFQPRILRSIDEKITFLRSLFHHEAYHWILIPHDKVTSAVLVERAMKYLNNPKLARVSVNIVADAILEHRIASEFYDLQEKRMQVTIDHVLSITTGNPSVLWQVIIYCLCHITGHQALLEKVEFNEEAVKTADGLVKILKGLDDEQRWPVIVQNASKLLKPLLEESKGFKTASNSSKRAEDNIIELPGDFEAVLPGMTELKTRENIGKKRGSKHSGLSGQDSSEIEKIARELEKYHKNFGKFGAGLVGAGIVDNSYEALRYFYRSKAKKFLDLRAEIPRNQGLVPRNVKKWTLEDPVEEIDISLAAGFGNRLIPGINTFKWQTEFGIEMEKQVMYPDLLVVIDSSGSMTRSKSFLSGSFDLSALAAFSAIQTALAAGVKNYCAINFSSRIRDSGWTNNIYEVENVVLAYQGGGTILPVKRIKERIEEHSRLSRAPVFVLIFTDFGLVNWHPVKKLLTSVEKSNVFKLFYIAPRRQRLDENISYLSGKGIDIFLVTKAGDLVDLARKEITEIYRMKR
ncbi:MAG: hypothetical protein ACFFD4_30240 [Candidatus Odinarchaeota archaeon]